MAAARGGARTRPRRASPLDWAWPFLDLRVPPLTPPPLCCPLLLPLPLQASVALMAPLEPLSKKLLAQALTLFAHPSDGALRLQAALFIREMAITLPPPALDGCLKGAYGTFASHAKFVTAGSLPVIGFMASFCVELYGLQPEASYARAFAYIRQAALQLRDALASSGKDALQKVYCWQYVNCVELWAAVLAAHAAASGGALRPLVYPLVQVLLGAARLVPTARYFPLRLRLARATHALASATGTYVPLAPLLLEVLGFAGLSKPATGGGAGGKGFGQLGGNAVDLELTLRVPAAATKSAGFQQAVVEAALELLACHLGQW